MSILAYVPETPAAPSFLHRLQYGPGMRVQRLVEASFIVAAFVAHDVRLVWVTVVLAALQAISGRLVPIAALVTWLAPAPRAHALSDLYFDLDGSRGACALSTVAMLVGIGLVRAGHDIVGFLLLAMPAASFLLAPTVGFCAGCAVYVGIREALVRVGLIRRYTDGARDVAIGAASAPRGE